MSKQTKSEQTNFVLYFGEPEIFPREFKSKHKKLLSAPYEGIPFVLYGDKKLSIKSFFNKKGVTLSHLSLILFDIRKRKSFNGYYYDSKTSTVYLFSSSKEEEKKGIVNVSIAKAEEGNLKEFFENFFGGDAYIKVSDSEKVLNTLYGKKQTTLMVLIALLFLGIVYIGYTMFGEDVAITKPPPPPAPIIKPLSLKEKHILQHKLSLLMFEEFLGEVDAFKEKDLLNIQRILQIVFGGMDELPLLAPTLNATTNKWEWQNGMEKYKRGGFKARLEVLYQKKYPSSGYKLSRKSTEDSIAFYNRSETRELEVLTEELDSNDSALVLDKVCLEATLAIAKDVVPEKNTENYIYFSISNEKPSLFYTQIYTLFRHCPLEVVNMMAREDKMTGLIRIRKGGSE